jgi:hypothetical protein
MDETLKNVSWNMSQQMVNVTSSVERTDIKFSMAIFQALTLAILGLYAVAIYKKIDTSHPVFAVIFQETLALIVLQFVCLMAYLPMMAVAYG